MSADDWFAAFVAWLRPLGFYAATFAIGTRPEDWKPAGFYILGGQSPRGSHAVVARGDEVVHDPHPSRAGLLRREDATVLIPLDPARAGRRLPLRPLAKGRPR
jgi:hypothetical protein